MYRKGTFNCINESLSEFETHGRICKTPRLVLNKLNIPLDSVVIVKGDTVTIAEESSKNLPSESHNIIDITASDDDLSNDVVFQNMVIQRFHSNKDSSSDEKSELNPSQSSEKFDCDQTSSSFEQQSEKKYYSYGPKSRRKLLPHPKTIRKKIKGMSTVDEEKKSSEKHLQSESDECFSAAKSAVSEHNENSKIDDKMEKNDEDQTSKTVSKSTSYVLSPLKNKNTSVDRKNGHNSNKKTIDADVAEIIAILEDSPVEGDENEKHDNISENRTSTTQPDFTPSRTSQRIKNKKVKFSALRLLAGGEIPSTKKKVQTNSLKKTSTPKKSVGKTKANSTADINSNNSDLSPIVSEEFSSINKVMKENTEENEDSFDRLKLNKSSPHKPVKQYTHVKKMLASKNKLIENSEKVSLPSEKLIVNSPSKEKETNDLNSINYRKKNKINESRTNGSEEILQKSSLDRENIEIKEGSNKIRVELQGTAQKKIVNITISPKKSSLRHEGLQKDNVKEKKDIELGPDIIIRKVKSGKKQESDKTVTAANDENDKTMPKNDNVPGSKPENSVNIVSDVFQNNLIIKNLIYPEKTTKSGIKPMQEVEVPPQIKKFIQETTKNKKPNENSNDSTVNSQKTSAVNKTKKKSEFNRKKYETKNKQKARRMQSSDEEDSDRELELNDTPEPDNSDTQIINSTLDDDDEDEEEDRTTVADSSTDKVTKKSTGDSKKHSREEILSSNVIRVGGKKTAKVMPLRQVTKLPLKSDMIKKAYNDKFKPINEKDIIVSKPKTIPRLSSPTELSIGGKRNYKNAFEKYFICTEKIYEHNDSMDSDSSSDDDTLFSHFIDLRRRNKGNKEMMDETVVPENNEEILNQPENNSEQINTAYTEDNSVISELGEVLKGIIAADLPKWTCHTLPENSVICLLLLERETNGTYNVKKSIEIDANFNANVYVEKKLVNEYCGVYDSYESIKNLIYQVELL